MGNKLSKVIFFPLFLIVVCAAYSQEYKPRLAVLDFVTESLSQKEMKSTVGLLSSALFETEKYDVIDVAQRQMVLDEIEFSLSGCSDESCQLEIGKLLSAELIVVGSIDVVGERYILTCKMLETATARTVSTANGIYLTLNDLIDNLQAIADRLAGIEYGDNDSDIVQKDRTEKFPSINTGRLITGISLATAGSITAILSYFFILPNQQDVAAVEAANAAWSRDPQNEQLETDYTDLYSAYTRSLWTGYIVMGAATVTALSSILFFLPPKKAGTSDIAFQLTPALDGVAFSVRLSY